MAHIRNSSPIGDLDITQYLKELCESYGLATVGKVAKCEGSTLRLIKGFGSDKIRILTDELDKHRIPHRLRE